MRLNETMLGYLNANEAVRRQAENPYLYLNQFAELAKMNRMFSQQKDIVTELKNTDSISLKSRENQAVKKEERFKNNLLSDGKEELFYNSAGKMINIPKATFEYYV